MGRESQNIQCNLGIGQACEDGDNMWFASNAGNLLCRLNKKTGVIHKECVLLKANDGIYRAYGKLCKWNDYIVIPPLRGKTVILIYSVREKKLQEIYLRNLKTIEGKPKFSMCFVYKDFVYLTGLRYPAIVRLNMKSLRPEYIVDWIPDIDDCWEKSDKAYLRHGDIVENTAMLPFADASDILKVDLDTGDTYIVPIPFFVKGFNSLSYAKENFWFVDNYGNKLTIWSPDTNAISEIEIHDEEKRRKWLFARTIVAQDHLLLIPYTAAHAYWVSIETGEVQKCTELEPYILKNREKSGMAFSGCRLILQNSDGIYLDFEGNDTFYFYQFSNRQWNPLKKTCEKDLADIIVSLKYRKIVVENDTVGLETLLEDLADVDFPDLDRQKLAAVGETIYQVLKL